MKPSNTQMMFFMEKNEGNGLEDTEVIHQEDREGDSNRIILSDKVTKAIKVIKEIKVIQTINKVTREIHKEEINNVEIFEVSQILEATTDLVTRWIPVIIS